MTMEMKTCLVNLKKNNKPFNPKYGCPIILMSSQDKLGGSPSMLRRGHEPQIRPEHAPTSGVPC